MLGRRLAFVIAGLALVAGCGSGSSGGEAEPSTPPSSAATPPRVYTLDELKAALPRISQVPTASEDAGTCPGDDTCDDGTVSVTFKLSRPVSSAEQERLAGDEFSSDFVSVSATAEKDPAAAEAKIAKARESSTKYDGAFDIPPKSVSETRYTPGQKGTGTLVDATVAGWEGFDASREQTFSSPEGEGGAHPYQSTQLMVSKGPNVVRVDIVAMSEPRGAGSVSKLARQLATEYIARLG